MTIGATAIPQLMEQLRAVVDSLAALDPAELSDGTLAEELVALRHQMDRQDAVFSRLAWAGHVRGVGAIDGAASTAAFIRHHTGMRNGDARAAIECGEVSELLAETGEAWRAGEISTGAARTIVAARVDSHDDELVACEPLLLDLARAGNMRSLHQATAHFRNLALADGSEPGEHDGLTLSQTYAGTTVLHGELSDAAAETVATVLNVYTDPPDADDPRTHAQRQAAALVQICGVAIAHLNSQDRPRTAVSLVVDWNTLTQGELGRSDGEFTGPIHPLDIQRLLCDSTITRIVTGPDSLPLDLGRSRRTVPPSLRKALVIRDGGCRWPGCNKPPGWCDAHHTTHWIDGGETKPDHLVLFCDHHHGMAHKPGWTVTFDGRVLTIRRPDGSVLT